jgi:hypothetical protein
MVTCKDKCATGHERLKSATSVIMAGQSKLEDIIKEPRIAILLQVEEKSEVPMTSDSSEEDIDLRWHKMTKGPMANQSIGA